MKNLIYKTITNTTLLIIFIGLSSFTLIKVLSNNEIKVTKNGFAVLELFTSQGCSSCPSADAVLAKYALQNNPNIIPLSFHVNYWDYMGWKDPFSKAQFTERQRKYASQLNTQGNYTPQLIINGKYELVGSKENEIERLVNKELDLESKNTISIVKQDKTQDQLNVEFELGSYLANTTVNVALVKKKELTNIKRGENRGLKQMNYNIVYDFISIPSSPKLIIRTNFKLKSDWLSSDFLLVAYLQNSKTGQIITGTKSIIN
ncbi:DUF1223 domain-containing protein [Flavobacterium sp.]|uniref:DUF1223 domain-containing protein n=1 Tax=Flavobacterium sp. TaxID=239 RepID=UPI00286E80B9|nr:DUF1223 domain-containing protein [Flavobacterium sp.]